MAEAQFVRVTYREISERFGIGIEGARLKAKRRAEKGLWRIIPGNHPQDVVRVEVPEDEFTSGENAPQRGMPRSKHELPPTNAPPQQAQRRDTNDLDGLIEIISQLTIQLQPLTDRLIEAERAKAEAEKEAAISRAALESVEARLTALTQASDIERCRLQDEIEVLRQERDAERQRAAQVEVLNAMIEVGQKRVDDISANRDAIALQVEKLNDLIGIERKRAEADRSDLRADRDRWMVQAEKLAVLAPAPVIPAAQPQGWWPFKRRA